MLVRRLVLVTIAFLSVFASSTARAQQGFTRRVWAESPTVTVPVDVLGSPSPDDRLLSFVDWSTGDLAVRELASGQVRRLTNKGPWDRSVAFALMSVFSRDARSVAYNWYSDGNTHIELRVVDVATTASRVLLRVPLAVTNEYIEPADFTPDGAYVVATGQQAGFGRIVLVPTDSGAPRVVKAFTDWRYPATVRVSPDGNYIAYSYPPRREDGRREIFVLPVSGGTESVVAAHDADDYVIGWTPDGARLVFGSDRGGSPSVYTVEVSAGRARGIPSLVRRDLWRAVGMRMSPRGVMYYSVKTGDQDVMVASADTLTGKLRAPPVSVTQRPGYRYSWPAWSPDGRSVAYFTALSDNNSAIASRSITIRVVDNGDARQLWPRLSNAQALVWSHDGRSLIMRATDERNRDGIFRLDLGSGEVSLVVDRSRSIPGSSPDGRMMYYAASVTRPGDPPDATTRIVVRDLQTGQERDVYVAQRGFRVGPAARIAVSRDGSRLGFLTRDSTNRAQWMLVGANGGAPRPAIDPRYETRAVAPQVASFSADGRYFIYATVSPAGPAAQTIWRVPVDGGPPEELLDGVQHFQMSPDGRRVTYIAGYVADEVWVLEDPALGFRRASAPSRR